MRESWFTEAYFHFLVPLALRQLLGDNALGVLGDSVHEGQVRPAVHVVLKLQLQRVKCASKQIT